jgi:hypothetical protein
LCCSTHGPRYRVLVTVENFGASLLLSRTTLEQLHCRFDTNYSKDKAAIHLDLAGCMHVVDKTGDGSNPEIKTYPSPRALEMPPGLVDEQRAATLPTSTSHGGQVCMRTRSTERDLVHKMLDMHVRANTAEDLTLDRARHKKLRLCTDYTDLNKGVGKTVLGIRGQMAGSERFIQMDGCSAYRWRWCYSQADRRASSSLWFGHEAAPGALNHVMEHILADVPNTHVYLDDILSGVSSDADAGIPRFRNTPHARRSLSDHQLARQPPRPLPPLSLRSWPAHLHSESFQEEFRIQSICFFRVN